MILLLFAETASAHPNHDGGSPLAADLLHLLGAPDHLAAILLPLVAAVALALVLGRRLKPARRSGQTRCRGCPGRR
ncbi:MAG TPA: hypothetical protein VLA41_07675 [Burkholderiales bacterium]|nr:hypothetical protein [Burkholderiales bacterium]